MVFDKPDGILQLDAKEAGSSGSILKYLVTGEGKCWENDGNQLTIKVTHKPKYRQNRRTMLRR